jgi:hypothetical protein
LDYEARRFFFLVDPVDPLRTGVLLPPSDANWLPPPAIDSLQVWCDDRIQSNNGGAVPGVALLDVRPGAPAESDSIRAFFDLWTEHADFDIRDDLVATTIDLGGGHEQHVYPVLDLLIPLGSGEVLAATFRATFALPQGGTRVIRYGLVAADGTMRAKALYIPDGEYTMLHGDFYSRSDYWYPVRRLELRNIYRLRLQGSGFRSIEVGVRQTGLGNTNFPGMGPDVTYLRGLGVDKKGSHGQAGFDHHIDPEFIRDDLDLLILPDLRPFAPAAEDSVWPFFVQDLPNGRPAFFVGEDANANPQDVNQSFYDKRPPAIAPSEDSRYVFTITATP